MLKLNDCINPETITRGVVDRHCLKNSLKRNILLPSLELKPEFDDECTELFS